MKRILLACLILTSSLTLFAQNYNINLLSNFDNYSLDCSDIWGYVDEFNTEYAIMGVNDGTAVISLADPTNPVEIEFIPGSSSIWRDIKTWGDYAYVTTDQGNDGLLVIDLRQVELGVVNHTFWKPSLTVNGNTNTLETCHNIYIDEFGWAYLAGCNINNGGMLFIDVFSNPGNPQYVDAAWNVYSHDVYVRNNLMYSSDINDGFFSIHDVSDKSNPVVLATQNSPFNFTHNAWLNDAGTALFTTDELANAPIGSYDVSDPNNITFLDEFRPTNTIGQGLIPHNVHVLNDFIVTSHYGEGVTIVDASRPDILVQTGAYDTYPSGVSGFNGAWGAYPFLPSGRLLVSDIQTGLYVFDVDYQRAAYLEGTITDANTGNVINGATIEIMSANITESSDLSGNYGTGTLNGGSYTVQVSKAGYTTETATVTLTNGQTVVKDFQLDAPLAFTLSGQVVSSANGAGVPFAQVSLSDGVQDFAVTTNAGGNFTIPTFFEGSYNIFAAKWGYEYAVLNNETVDQTTGPLVITVDEGYEDLFELDLGWATSGNANTGDWERGDPVGTTLGGDPSNPEDDVNDAGVQCYVTGNTAPGGQAGSNDVDDGNVVLTSPVFDGTRYNSPRVDYYTWFVNDGGQGNPDDELTISITNGSTTVTLETITTSNGAWRSQSRFRLSDFITVTSTMQLIVETADLGNGHIVEAGFDHFYITELQPVSTYQAPTFETSFSVFPNPVETNLDLTINWGDNLESAQLQIIDAQGKLVHTHEIDQADVNVSINAAAWSAGTYQVSILTNETIIVTQSVMKIK